MSDVSAGEVFVTGQSVTAVRLNNHVNGLTILPAFVSAKPTISPVGADRLLSYQISGDQLNAPSITNVLALQLVDQAAGVASMRTLGVGATQASQGSLTPQKASDNTFTGINTFTGANVFSGDNTLSGLNVFTGAFNKFKHIRGTPGATILVGPGAGSGSAALGTNASDLSGSVTIVCAGTTIINSTLATITFMTAYTVAPTVNLIALNGVSIQNQATAKFFSVGTTTTTTFIIQSSASLPSAGTYTFTYIVISAGP